MQTHHAKHTRRALLVWTAVACMVLFVPATAAGQARGDFNGDGFDDLALGVPGEDIRDNAFNNVPDVGAVNVIYGSPTGLSATYAANQFWHQDASGVFDNNEAYDGFGSSLATGDFNGDGYDDLAIGVPGEDLGLVVDAGAVNILYGSASGLSSAGSQIWHQDSAGVQGVSQRTNHFGFALAVGD